MTANTLLKNPYLWTNHQQKGQRLYEKCSVLETEKNDFAREQDEQKRDTMSS